MEFIVVVGFLVAVLVLFLGSMVLRFLLATSDDDSEVPSFLQHRYFARAVAACLVLVALGFPVIASGNDRFFPASFLISGAALLSAVRVLSGAKARWAMWGAAGLIAVLVFAPLVFLRGGP